MSTEIETLTVFRVHGRRFRSSVPSGNMIACHVPKGSASCTPWSWWPGIILVSSVHNAHERPRAHPLGRTIRCRLNVAASILTTSPCFRQFHIVAFGTEECLHSIAKSVIVNSKREWEMRLKETLGESYEMLCGHSLQVSSWFRQNSLRLLGRQRPFGCQWRSTFLGLFGATSRRYPVQATSGSSEHVARGNARDSPFERPCSG